ncbi:ecto-ADP-ribosyltransferase 5 isoform X4 [Bos indicus x Bos taurus]|uniref:ecto-ADP-ribosyltransferase 5 isoform X4 n=2 Tax=Bos indicus x Bos taurus TaxID=30522 RepID=UPI000F7D0BEB|nr:ecto-ADP-ribosyltransferase 5 isoform X4 [Bos indicus x Bos taurus]
MQKLQFSFPLSTCYQVQARSACRLTAIHWWKGQLLFLRALGPDRALPGQVLDQGSLTPEKKGSKSLSPSPLKPRKTIAGPTFIWISPSKNPARMIQATLLISLSCLSFYTLGSGVRRYDPGQGVTIQYLSLAPDTFDDAYVGCSEEMEEKAVLLLEKEMANHTRLRESWETAQKAWEQKRAGLTLPPGFRSQHGIAIMVYTNSSNTLYRELNQAVRTGGGSWESYMKHFPFKALHFYLTRALQLLRGGGGCSREPRQEVFRGVRRIHFVPKSVGDSIRLGQFASSSLDEAVARRFGSATFFSLRTCSGAPIQALSVFPEEREVLIPPYEVFVRRRGQAVSLCQEGRETHSPRGPSLCCPGRPCCWPLGGSSS